MRVCGCTQSVQFVHSAANTIDPLRLFSPFSHCGNMKIVVTGLFSVSPCVLSSLMSFALQGLLDSWDLQYSRPSSRTTTMSKALHTHEPMMNSSRLILQTRMKWLRSWNHTGLIVIRSLCPPEFGLILKSQGSFIALQKAVRMWSKK